MDSHGNEQKQRRPWRSSWLKKSRKDGKIGNGKKDKIWEVIRNHETFCKHMGKFLRMDTAGDNSACLKLGNNITFESLKLDKDDKTLLPFMCSYKE
jgi:hypothetical protein